MDASLAGLVRAGTITMAAAETRSSPAGRAAPPGRARPTTLADARWPPDGRRDLHLQGRRRRRHARRRARSPAPSEDAVTEELQGPRPQGHGPRREEVRLKMEHLARAEARQGRRADGHDAPAGDDDLLGHDAPARVLRARGPDREQEAQGDARRGPRGHRGRPRFSDALAKHPKVFNPLYVAMVRAGEAGGVLEESLDRIADQLEKDDALRRQVKARDGLPDRRADLRAVRPDRPDRVHRPRVRERLQGLRRRAAADHQVHRRRCPTSSRASGTS